MIPIAKPYIGTREKELVMEVLDSGMLVQGSKVAALETAFAEVCNVKHAIATTSGTTALHIALLAHGIGEGDEVITTPFTFIASANSILFTGATPVFVDIDIDTFNIDPKLIEAAITPRTKAILPVHLYGYMCDMKEIMDIAEKHKLIVIEDACQAVGASYQGKKSGSFGTGTFSLYATKNVMSGEGGMVSTDDDEIARRCKLLRSHGMKVRYYHDMLGYNYRMSDLLAAIGVAQMERLEEFNAIRKENAKFLSENIKSVIVPKVKLGYDHVWHQYTIRIDGNRDRDAAVKQLNGAGIGTGIFYPVPVHQQVYMREIIGDNQFPVSEKLAKQVISLPVHPQVSQADLEKIVEEVNKL
ncbi:MAG: DegT/DnrJ/EryC1/StrS aminotransferase family protein [Chloroflexota bacterium]|nr:DegT/DnrJ/EryC1/StrS aminotransferase family protein [Chloroflexota bacterium]